jgi:hypothetical protein
MARVAPKHVFADMTHRDAPMTSEDIEAELRERGIPVEMLQSLLKAPVELDWDEDPDPYHLMKDVAPENGTELDVLAKLPAAEQRSLAEAAKRGEKVSAITARSYAKLQQANAELQIELHDVKRRAADGDLFDLENDCVETIAGTIIEKVGIDKAVEIACAILNSPEHDEQERAEREQEL